MENEVELTGLTLNSHAIEGDNWSLATDNNILILNKIEHAGISLGQYVDKNIYWGIKTGLNDAFVIDANIKDHLLTKMLRAMT